MKIKIFQKRACILIIVWAFGASQSEGQTTGLSGTGANTQVAGTAGTDNTNLGANSGNSIVAGGNQNTNLGKDAGTAITTADDNTCVGYQAGLVNNIGYNNCFIGSGSGQANVAEHDNTFVGFQSGFTDPPAESKCLINSPI